MGDVQDLIKEAQALRDEISQHNARVEVAQEAYDMALAKLEVLGLTVEDLPARINQLEAAIAEKSIELESKITEAKEKLRK